MFPSTCQGWFPEVRNRHGDSVIALRNMSKILNCGLLSVALVASGCSALQSAQDTGDPSLSNPNPSLALAFQSDSQLADGLTRTDRARLTTAEARALDYGKAGEEIDWKGDSDTTRGTVQAFQPFRVGQSSCRRFQHEIVVKGETRQTNATACRTSNGGWRLVR